MVIPSVSAEIFYLFSHFNNIHSYFLEHALKSLFVIPTSVYFRVLISRLSYSLSDVEIFLIFHMLSNLGLYPSHFEHYLMGLYGEYRENIDFFVWLISRQRLDYVQAKSFYPPSVSYDSNIISFFKIRAIVFKYERNKNRAPVGEFSLCT